MVNAEIPITPPNETASETPMVAFTPTTEKAIKRQIQPRINMRFGHAPDSAQTVIHFAERQEIVMFKVFAILLICVASAIGQTTTIIISDTNGNQTTGTISSGNVYFHDNNGNTSFGTIRDGNVFMSTSKGEITFGTIKNGNVFLTDQGGNTTGTIRNGNIFLLNSDGSITTGTYNKSGSMTTTTTSTANSTATVQQPENSSSAQQTANYQAGYAVGQQLGGAVAVAINRHRIRSYCKKHASGGYWRFANGTVVSCALVNASR